ncbi:MAG TPA: MerR family transcriptional regulator [Terriglobales bacterium]|nr:MerR family transcriptional regulator [Terriglobales bacterium]
MLTVSKLAERCGLSRSTLLYYESIGLMKAAVRSDGNYRCYGEPDVARLRQICVYRDAGLKLEDIRALLDGAQTEAASVLQRRLSELNSEIETLRGHQRAILRLLQNRRFWRTKVITKDKWVEIMRSTGFSEDDMHRWHGQFEKMAPSEHQEFLEFLHIQPEEIKSIREWSKKTAL